MPPPLQSLPSMVLSRPKGGSDDPFAADTPQSAILHREAVANPSPLGLFAFALTSLLMTGANTALTEDGPTQHRVACYGLMYGGLAQILAAVYEMKRGSTFGATTFYTYGGYWVGLSLLTLLRDGGAGGLAGGAGDSAPHADQMVLVLYGALTVIFFGATLRMNRALQAVFFGLAVLHFLLAAGLSFPVARHVAGWWGIGVSLTATYTGVAELYNEVYGRVVIPLGEVRAKKPSAVAAAAAAAKKPSAAASAAAGVRESDREGVV